MIYEIHDIIINIGKVIAIINGKHMAIIPIPNSSNLVSKGSSYRNGINNIPKQNPGKNNIIAKIIQNISLFI